MRLSNRLTKIIECVEPCDRLGDIGTDHGFVPITLVQKEVCKKAYACDVKEGPILRARAHVEQAHLEDRIECCKGDGLEPLFGHPVDTIIIAGMGGLLIQQILEAGRDVLFSEDGRPKVKQLVFSPHTEIPALRKYVLDLGFSLEKEEMVLEEGKYYVIFSFVQGEKKRYTDLELKYGPLLLKNRSEVFLSYLEKRFKKNEKILEQVQKEEILLENSEIDQILKGE